MSKTQNLLAGLAGAIALNILHESLKKTDSAMPRVDLLGEEALQKLLNYFGTGISNENDLYKATLAGDLFSNALYYSFIGAGKRKNIMANAVTLGLAAGVGALVLPKPMGLNPKPVTKTAKTKVLTIAYYLTGALVAGAVMKKMNKR